MDKRKNSFEIVDLFQCPEHLVTVSRWIYSEFWSDKEGYSPEFFADLLRNANRPKTIPLSLLAKSGGKPLGTINLIENDDENRTHLRPWLAALYVVPDARNSGIGAALVRELLERAREIKISTVYLGTDNPKFYEKLGAIVYEEARPNFFIMTIQTEKP